eukprot:TRINITY_DN22256_c0_g1_i1.p1 TRINITY_DN22256_c0_g1~~TRINITY_DN22256_c0_g1_i1.p1  ORF type:complete len:664 (+),score=50.49 TRINITY_DN22256_c0_g1_i1:186-1994(+)
MKSHRSRQKHDTKRDAFLQRTFTQKERNPTKDFYESSRMEEDQDPPDSNSSNNDQIIVEECTEEYDESEDNDESELEGIPTDEDILNASSSEEDDLSSDDFDEDVLQNVDENTSEPVIETAPWQTTEDLSDFVKNTLPDIEEQDRLVYTALIENLASTKPEVKVTPSPAATVRKRRPPTLTRSMKIILKWWSRNPSVSKTVVQSLLKEIGKEKIDGKDLPKSVNGLLAAEEPFLQTIPLIEGESNGIKYWYRDPITLLSRLVEHYYDELIWEYDKNEGKIEHWLNSRAARRYSHITKLLATLYERSTKSKIPVASWKMLLPVLFEDDYTVKTKRTKKQGGVYITLANFPSKKCGRKRMFLLCILPQGIDKLFALLDIIVRPLQNLERGIVMRNLKNRPGNHYFLGSLLALLGDHLGLSFLECITPPTSLTPCRFCLLLKWNIPLMHVGQLREPRLYPQVKKYVDYLNSAQRGLKETYRNALTQQGFLGVVSPFWGLLWMRPNFFMHFAQCFLHLELEGIYKYHILYLSAIYFNKYGNKFLESIEQGLQQVERYPGLEIPKKLVKFSTSKVCPGREVLKMATFSWGQVDTFVQLSVVIFERIL